MRRFIYFNFFVITIRPGAWSLRHMRRTRVKCQGRYNINTNEVGAITNKCKYFSGKMVVAAKITGDRNETSHSY